MRFYNFLKRKPIKQDKKHQPKPNPDSGRWFPPNPARSKAGMGTLPSRYSDQRAQIIKN